MKESVRHIIDSLRRIAAEPNAAGNGLVVAEMHIDDCLRPLGGSERSAAIDDVCKAAQATVKDHPAQEPFWQGVIDYLTHRCQR